MNRLILLALLPILAACSTPRESCLRAASRDLVVVDRLIAQVQGNLARGYAVDREPYVTSTVDLCVGNRGYRGIYGGGVGFSYCSRPVTRYRANPVAIDRQTEERKLRELKQTRARLEKQVNANLEACNARYPLG